VLAVVDAPAPITDNAVSGTINAATAAMPATSFVRPFIVPPSFAPARAGTVSIERDGERAVVGV
jgi:hypothetical protein